MKAQFLVGFRFFYFEFIIKLLFFWNLTFIIQQEVCHFYGNLFA